MSLSFEATNDDIKAFPVGLSVVSGNQNARSPPPMGATTNLDPSKGDVTPVKWTCPRANLDSPGWPPNSNGLLAGMQDPNNKGEGVGFPDVECDGYASPLRADIHFPSCYNPKAGLTNHKENMVFPSDAGNGKSDCPKGYVHVPHLFIEVYWNTPLFKDRWEQGKGTQPFVLSNGDPTGYSSHADFMAGWNEDLLQHIIDTCDAGTSGMDKCPGLNGLNKGDCTIDSPVDEKVTGVLDKLPGFNDLSGWSYGGNGTNPGSGGDDTPIATDSKPSGGGKPTGKPSGKPTAVTAIENAPTEKPSQGSGGGDSQPTLPTKGPACSRRIHYVTETITVTAPMPGMTNTPSSNSTGAVGGFKFAGCFKDSQDRALSGEIRANLGAISNERCVSHCKSAGFALAGTEYGGQCYCGNELVGSEKLEDSACDMVCEGDASDKCGGSWALSVYSKDGEASLKGTKGRRHTHEHVKRHQGSHH